MTVQTLKPPFYLYRTLLSWHFYAGLFCVPFIIILALSGSLYLFKPQVEAWLDRPYDNLAFAGAPASADDQIKAALAAVPGGTLKSYEVRHDPHDAAHIAVSAKGETVLIYVHPQTLAITSSGMTLQDLARKPAAAKAWPQLHSGFRGHTDE